MYIGALSLRCHPSKLKCASWTAEGVVPLDACWNKNPTIEDDNARLLSMVTSPNALKLLPVNTSVQSVQVLLLLAVTILPKGRMTYTLSFESRTICDLPTLFKANGISTFVHRFVELRYRWKGRAYDTRAVS